MKDGIRRVTIVGGGTAGWLAAARLAAAARAPGARPIEVTLVESPDLPTIGVGEGTWPTIRRTLRHIGIGEDEFVTACDAAWKQGSRFVGWATGGGDDAYVHPFTPPADLDARDAVATWRVAGGAFADAVGPQPAVAALGLAPRQRSMPPYAGALNYAYHLDAAKLAALLARHATARLGVRHVRDHVVAVDRAANADIAAVRTRSSGTIAGDLFLDCTGHAALLIGETLGVGLVDHGAVLFNDRALAVQVPVAPDGPVACQTDATAHAAGWIWDIGLPTRRGIGCVYASAHMSDDAAAATLSAYLARTAPDAGIGEAAFRRLAFRSAHRERFWVGNCLAIGLAAGFLEPLEASAIVLIELSLDALIDDFPADRAGMDVRARRFDALFGYRWARIVEFLKLHYALGRRPEPYWAAHRDPATMPPRLADLLALWRDRPPLPADFPHAEEVFPWASWQYVLYGMGFPAPAGDGLAAGTPRDRQAVARQVRRLAQSLPDHRAALDALRATAPIAGAAHA